MTCSAVSSSTSRSRAHRHLRPRYHRRRAPRRPQTGRVRSSSRPRSQRANRRVPPHEMARVSVVEPDRSCPGTAVMWPLPRGRPHPTPRLSAPSAQSSSPTSCSQSAPRSSPRPTSTSLRRVVDAQRGNAPSLQESPAFSRAMEEAGNSTDFLVFCNVRRIVAEALDRWTKPSWRSTGKRRSPS